ncbi:MAG TPA: hypothetical protein VHL53_14470 [Acidimicrobiia bacterium]|nr:hypothetical protein [Acidimicrobiia bacterium]
MNWELGLTLPPQWYRWDRDDEVGSSARAVDAWLAEHPGFRPARQALLRLLLETWADATDQGALAAAVLWQPAPGAALAARLFVLVAERKVPGDETAEIDALLDALGTPSPHDLRFRECEPVDLPAGRAVRLRRLSRTGDADPGEPEMAVDMVQHWVPVPGGTETVILAGETPCVAVSDDLASVFDAIAGSLELRLAN